MEFLGFFIDSQTTTLALPREKVRKVKKSPSGYGERASQTVDLYHSTRLSRSPPLPPLSGRQKQSPHSSEFIGLPGSAFSPGIKGASTPWRDNFDAWNGKSLISGTPDLITETDASREGWGAFCMGVATGGQWSQGESQLYINCLELLKQEPLQ